MKKQTVMNLSAMVEKLWPEVSQESILRPKKKQKKTNGYDFDCDGRGFETVAASLTREALQAWREGCNTSLPPLTPCCNISLPPLAPLKGCRWVKAKQSYAEAQTSQGASEHGHRFVTVPWAPTATNTHTDIHIYIYTHTHTSYTHTRPTRTLSHTRTSTMRDKLVSNIWLAKK